MRAQSLSRAQPVGSSPRSLGRPRAPQNRLPRPARRDRAASIIKVLRMMYFLQCSDSHSSRRSRTAPGSSKCRINRLIQSTYVCSGRKL